MPNIFDPEFDQQRDKPGFTRERAFIGRQAGAQKLGASVWVMEPAELAYPYHFHYGEEEMLIVISGRPSLRTPEGWRELEPGDVVSFPVGPDGAHQLANNSDEQVRFLAISTVEDVDVVLYPDSDKVSASYRKGLPEEFRGMFQKEDGVDYWNGEEAPSS
ncbi:MAG: cupin domain-containing protein [Solirubrobacterales bacterium]